MPAFVRCTLLACALLCPLPAVADPLCVYVFTVSGSGETPLAGVCDVPVPVPTSCRRITPEFGGEPVLTVLACLPP